MPSIANFSLFFDFINDSGTFSEGDTISGKVYLELLKPSKVQSLSVKAKRVAFVGWMDEPMASGGISSYSAPPKVQVLKKETIISMRLKETVLPVGSHLLPFNIQLPSKKYLPSSFSGAHGLISYQLQAKLCRRNKLPRKVRETFTFHSKSVPRSVRMSPQTASTKSIIGTDRKDVAELEVRLERNAFAPGETVKIVAKITNSSNHVVKPLFGLKQDVVYAADDILSLSRSQWVKVGAGSNVSSHTEMEQVCQMLLPPETPLTLHNCSRIKTKYSLEVSLEVLNSNATLQVCLPVVIIAREVSPGVCFPPEDRTES